MFLRNFFSKGLSTVDFHLHFIFAILIVKFFIDLVKKENEKLMCILLFIALK